MNTEFGRKAMGNVTLKEVLKPGTSLQNGKYLIIETYGQGPFTVSYLAQQTLLGRKVIINEFFLIDHCSRTPGNEVTNNDLEETIYRTFMGNWLGEAVMLSKCVGNEHFVRVLDTFEENRTVYYITEYVNEEDLRTYTLARPEKRLSEKEAIRLILQITQGLTLLHTNGIFHLNLSPVKVLIDKKGQAVIFSVGIARKKIPTAVIGDARRLARPGYTSPELYEMDCSYGAWTDIYSVGAILYFLLTGQDPVAAPDRAGTPLIEPCKLNPSVSGRVNAAIMKAMAPEPGERFRNLDDFCRALPSISEVPATVEPGRRKILLPALAVLALAILAGTIVIWLKNRGETSNALPGMKEQSAVDSLAHPAGISHLMLSQDKLRGMTMLRDAGTADSLVVGKYYALLIGIADYKDKRYEKRIPSATSIFSSWRLMAIF
ncbi:MAG TPA: serine/threonine-protein kinase, partial [Bacteroidales bacterium]|nr:serine/threonine-protein kinase [Bacteroidales bacterium]HPS63648.1 serine/threonine-protein kinase [Bacteroidales bacterium]